MAALAALPLQACSGSSTAADGGGPSLTDCCAAAGGSVLRGSGPCSGGFTPSECETEFVSPTGANGEPVMGEPIRLFCCVPCPIFDEPNNAGTGCQFYL
jgi:hypothetical protein